MLELLPGEWCPSVGGRYSPLDVNQLAAENGLDLTSKFVIRFQQRGRERFVSGGHGLIIDDVKLYDPSVKYASLPFSDDFDDTGVLDSAWQVRFADATSVVRIENNATTSPMGFVAIVNAPTSQFAVSFGSRCKAGGTSAPYTTNALDLHLMAAGSENVVLTFDLYDGGDDTDADDGIYLSVDGGQSFTVNGSTQLAKIYSFDFTEQPNRRYFSYSLNLDSLAAEAGLELTDSTIVRFQQRGRQSLSKGGIFLDNVSVTARTSRTVDVWQGKVEVYPNPAYDQLTVAFESLIDGIILVEIFDARGVRSYHRILEQGETQLTLNTHALPHGFYRLTLTSISGATVCRNFLVQ